MNVFDPDIKPTLCLHVQPGYAEFPARCQENYGHPGSHRERFFKGPCATWPNDEAEETAA